MTFLFLVMAFSIILQFTSAFLAIRLIRLTGWNIPWFLISAALILMGVRRVLSFYDYFLDNKHVDFYVIGIEFSALIISILMFAGVLMIGNVFRQMKEDEQNRAAAEAELRKSVEEKKAMLLEIHHRVKNNLAVVSSLIDLQSAKINDKECLSVFDGVQQHLKAMGIVHNIIYESSDLRLIDMKEFVLQLVEIYRKTFAFFPVIDIMVKDVKLDIQKAVPCAMIISELINNTLKHAFPEKRGDERVEIEFSSENDYCRFAITDNGVGFPEEIDLQNPKTMGLQILNILINQLKGSIWIDRGAETKTAFRFPKG